MSRQEPPPDPWSTLANVFLAEGVRAAIAQLIGDVRIEAVDMSRDRAYDIVDSSWDSKAGIVRLMLDNERPDR